jgi:hypothetical protein
MSIITVGLDLAKSVFAVHGVGESDEPELLTVYGDGLDSSRAVPTTPAASHARGDMPALEWRSWHSSLRWSACFSIPQASVPVRNLLVTGCAGPCKLRGNRGQRRYLECSSTCRKAA